MSQMTEETVVAPSAHEFCKVLSDARYFKLSGYWQGSAYRHHPCGVIRNNIIFCNEWHVDNHCSARVILDPTSQIIPAYRDSFGNGDPHPEPKNGGTILVYSHGSWVDEDGPWRKIIVDVINELKSEIEICQKEENRVKLAEENRNKECHKARIEAARKIFENNNNEHQ